MKDDFQELVTEAFTDVLEKLAFMFSESFIPDGPLEAPANCVSSRVGFHGVRSGLITLIMPKDLCQGIAASILGIEADDVDAEARALDALKELTNVTCGHVLTELAGTDPIFDLSVPSIETVNPEDWERTAQSPGTMVFMVEEEDLVLLNIVIRP